MEKKKKGIWIIEDQGEFIVHEEYAEEGTEKEVKEKVKKKKSFEPRK